MKIALLGDLFLSGAYECWTDEECLTVLSGLSNLLKSHDICVANFEGVILDAMPDAGDCTKKIVLPVRAAFAQALANVGLDVVGLSNNHVFDFGLEGLASTKRGLDAVGVTGFGAGASAREAGRLELVTIGSVRVGLIGFTCETTHPDVFAGEGPGVLRLQDPSMLDRIVAARRECDLLVVSVHWGDEHVAWPRPDQLRLARAMVDHGADVIAGHHAHVFQGCERYRHGVIAYGLGNVSISALRRRVCWGGVEQDYVFEPGAIHRAGVAVSVHWEAGCIIGYELNAFEIGVDGRPRLRWAPFRLLNYRFKRRVWHLPGYRTFYATVVWWQFRFAPRFRALGRMKTWVHVLNRIAGIPPASR